jgi:putative nucleotidyltransferase with HDIG domain
MQSFSSPALLKNFPNIHLLSELNAFAENRGIQLYLVGGSVRDLLLNREITDLDFAVDRDAIPFAKAFADRTGEAFVELEDQLPTARVVIRETLLTLDFTQFRAETLEADLRLRDFTINAIAIDLSSLLTQPTVKLIDPCHGFGDIEAKRLRFPDPQVVRDDPLRMLRAYRLAAELGFEMPEPTINLIRQHKEELSTVSLERIRDEFIKILNVKNSVVYLRQMDEIRLLSQVIPEIEDMRRVQQGDYHGLNIWEHSLLAIEMFEAKPVPDVLQLYDSEVQTYLNGTIVYGKKRWHIIKLGLMLHDVGKPAMKTINTENKVRFLDHEKVGAEIAVEIMKRLRLGRKVVNLMNCLVRNHLHIQYLVKSLPPTRQVMLRFLKNADEDWLGVILLSYADQRASQGRLCSPDGVSKTETVMCKIADLYYNEILPIVTRGRLITGHDVIQTLGLKPGIRVGRILKHIEALQFEGKIHTPEEALVAAQTFLEGCEA